MKKGFDYFERPDGVRLRFGKWDSKKKPSRGSLLFLTGRTEFMEKYSEPIERFNQLGLSVFSFDWRGQGLSSRLLKSRLKGHVGSYTEYLGDTAAFVKEIFSLESPPPRILAGHSMGGHIGLRFLKEYDSFFDKAVILSPMIDIITFPIPKPVLKYLARNSVIYGFDKAYLMEADRSSARMFEGNLLTSDRNRFEKAQKYIQDNPSLAVGGVTFGWLHASFESIDILHSPGFVESITVPVLLFSASNDRVVSNDAQREICRRIRNCRFIKIPGARHEILQEKNGIQKFFWEVFEKFVLSDF